MPFVVWVLLILFMMRFFGLAWGFLFFVVFQTEAFANGLILRTTLEVSSDIAELSNVISHSSKLIPIGFLSAAPDVAIFPNGALEKVGFLEGNRSPLSSRDVVFLLSNVQRDACVRLGHRFGLMLPRSNPKESLGVPKTRYNVIPDQEDLRLSFDNADGLSDIVQIGQVSLLRLVHAFPREVISPEEGVPVAWNSPEIKQIKITLLSISTELERELSLGEGIRLNAKNAPGIGEMPTSFSGKVDLIRQANLLIDDLAKFQQRLDQRLASEPNAIIQGELFGRDLQRVPVDFAQASVEHPVEVSQVRYISTLLNEMEDLARRELDPTQMRPKFLPRKPQISALHILSWVPTTTSKDIGSLLGSIRFLRLGDEGRGSGQFGSRCGG